MASSRDRVTRAELGHNIRLDSTMGKLYVTIDSDTIKMDEKGMLSVDIDSLGIKVVSDDKGNIISVGKDTGAMLSADTIKEIVGEMVASATDGIDYDALSNTLSATLLAIAVVDTETVDLTQTDVDGDISLKADVNISGVADNSIEVKKDGLYVPQQSEPITYDLTMSDVELIHAGSNGDNDIIKILRTDSVSGVYLGHVLMYDSDVN